MAPITDLWQEHKTRLRAYISRRVSDSHDVDDILQEVFLKAHVNLHTVKASGSISGWLYRIASNAIADHYRSQRSWKKLPDELTAIEVERDHIAELAVCLRPLIADLPDAYRVALTLSEIDGRPQKEVADLLGISLSGAKSRVQRGREKLRQRLLECCDIETGQGGIVGYEPHEKKCNRGCG
jgi:RNA polymerase sigma-70 factor (ECF subfamily)